MMRSSAALTFRLRFWKSPKAWACLYTERVDIRTVQELMGHDSISTTVRYAHLAPKHTLAAVELLAGGSTVEPTGTKTSTGPSKSLLRTKSFRCKMM
jgi:hypothetical protein